VSLHEVERGEGGILLDPFSGCGTAPVAARMLGMRAIGYDPHPFFARISEAKANCFKYWSDLPDIHRSISEGIRKNASSRDFLSESGWTFLEKMFLQQTLSALLGARSSLEGDGLDKNPLAFLILSRMLDYCCFASTDGIYKAPTSKKRASSPQEALDTVMKNLRSDTLEALSGSSDCQIICKSSENMQEVSSLSVDIIVTSPPYLNNFDFAEMTRMYLYFWRISDSWSEISDQIRSKLIINTTTALKGQKDIQENYRQSLPHLVRLQADAAVKELRQKRTEKAGKKDYDYLVYPYLSQMQSVLKESLRVLRSGAPLHMMVSDAALYGIHLPAPQWLGEIMHEAGFKDVQCEMIRARGHRWILDKREGSTKGLGEYYLFGRPA
jgi:DNA modification methylase